MNFPAFILIVVSLKEVYSFDIAGIPLPDLEIPDLEMPDLEMPDLELPEMPELPGFSDLSAPDMSDVTGALDAAPMGDTVSNIADSVPGMPDTAKNVASSVPDTVTNVPNSIPTTMPKPDVKDIQATAASMKDFSVSLVPYQSTEVREAIKTCRSKVEITTDDALTIASREGPQTKAGECFLTCIKKEIGLITENNTYSMERVKTTLEPLKTKNEALYTRLVNNFEECVDAGADEEDECLAAKKLRECVKEKRSQMRG